MTTSKPRSRSRSAARGGMAAVLLLGLPSAGCGQPSGPLPGDGDLRVLFVGNSLTYTNDLPAMVGALAEADGVDLSYAVEARPGFALGDHWDRGLADRISEVAADVVVLQQGPSSLESSRAYLVEWTERIDDVVRAAGGRSALFMVWPEATRLDAFDAVRESYAAAADSVGGIFIPAGETWRSAWVADPDLALYGPDGFHPSRTGSAAAAVTVYAMLVGGGAEEPPCPAGALVDEATATLLCAAMREAVGAYGVF